MRTWTLFGDMFRFTVFWLAQLVLWWYEGGSSWLSEKAYPLGIEAILTPAMGSIVPLLFFYQDGFGIKEPTKVEMPLNHGDNLYEHKVGSAQEYESPNIIGVFVTY